MRAPVEPPQSIADEHTLVAQKYAGYFLGHPFRAAQQRTGPDAIQVDANRTWQEPAVVSDGCAFCSRLSDAEVIRRIEGYQHAIDIEVLRARSDSYAEWLASGVPDIVDVEDVSVAGVTMRRGLKASQGNRRRFIETHRDKFDVTSIAMVDLPLRLKRKICIEWNHLYRDWLKDNPDIQYDPAHREFYRDVEQPEPRRDEHPKEWWTPEGAWGGSA